MIVQSFPPLFRVCVRYDPIFALCCPVALLHRIVFFARLESQDCSATCENHSEQFRVTSSQETTVGIHYPKPEKHADMLRSCYKGRASSKDRIVFQGRFREICVACIVREENLKCWPHWHALVHFRRFSAVSPSLTQLNGNTCMIFFLRTSSFGRALFSINAMPCRPRIHQNPQGPTAYPRCELKSKPLMNSNY